MSIAKHSELDEDYQWMQDKAFDFMQFYEKETIEYVCKIFKKKWICDPHNDKVSHMREKYMEYYEFEHVSPSVVQILDKLCYLNNKGLDENQDGILSLDELKSKAD